jgi:hypothetical protein
MKIEVKQLRSKAINSLTLCIENFNRPWDQGRSEAVLILLDHAFEMLMKAIIRHRGGKIRKSREKQTIGFDKCVLKGLTDAQVRFLTEEQGLLLQTINGLRDAAQHYLIDVSEHHLYFHAQAGVTLFRDLHDAVFQEALTLSLPERVLPISTTAPRDLMALFGTAVEEIRQLLTPGTRQKLSAVAKVRSLAVFEGAIGGEYEQPSDGDLKKLCDRIAEGEAWQTIFPGVSSINISATGEGHNIQLRLTKNEGVPVHVATGGEDSPTLAIRVISDLDKYSITAKRLAELLGLYVGKVAKLKEHLLIDSDPECFKLILGHKRYSQIALNKMRVWLAENDIQTLWETRNNLAA